MTADGVPVGIGDTVYAIWNEVRRNTRGKFYRASTIAVYPVKVTSVLFTESFVEHRVMWSGDGYANIPVKGSSDSVKPVEGCVGIELGGYNTFASKEKAEECVAQDNWQTGVTFFKGMPPMPSCLYNELRKKSREFEYGYAAEEVMGNE
jgi:hypothetical protein